MDRLVKVIIILAFGFLVILLWLGTKGTAILSKRKPETPPLQKEQPQPLKREQEKLSPEQLARIAQMLEEVEEKRKSATAEETKGLDELKQILQATKDKGRKLSREEMMEIFRKQQSPAPDAFPEDEPSPSAGPQEGEVLSPPLTEEEQFKEEPFLPAQALPDESQEEFPK